MGDNSLTEPLLPLNQAPTLPAIPGCPPDLEYLTHLDQILIHQQVELIEVFTGWETENKYQIKNALGQQIYFAAEESELCMRLCCKSRRGFMMHIIDNLNQEVMRVVRPFQCCAGCCWCADSCDHCALTISVETPGGEQIGHVRQRGSRWKPHFDILDSSYEPVLKIRGPCFRTPCCIEDVNFQLMTYDESQQIGKISKQWAGITKEWFTKADNFGITFPQDLDVKVKGTLLGALFLIDFMFYEHDKNNKSFLN
ncbi:Phospholipid scramblase 2 [Holothuria leucospilota]|uniref:Phospholipid scramblase n=1 Tax=Holothuria leucospilota TaxID=206669 RepID=A0A9Q1CPN9_HOLLE|nr:Phospholipid scramblase 2 [Holothuria leucospilota]